MTAALQNTRQARLKNGLTKRYCKNGKRLRPRKTSHTIARVFRDPDRVPVRHKISSLGKIAKDRIRKKPNAREECKQDTTR